MELVFKRPECLIDIPFHFCPGCHHGIAHRLVAEAIDYFKIREKTIGVASVGCSVFMYDYFNIDVLEAPHGRASAVASGVKRAKKGPNRLHLSGRWRSGSHWNCRGHPYSQPGGKHHHRLCQQRSLWDDRRTDGAHNASWTKDNHEPLWKRFHL